MGGSQKPDIDNTLRSKTMDKYISNFVKLRKVNLIF